LNIKAILAPRSPDATLPWLWGRQAKFSGRVTAMTELWHLLNTAITAVTKRVAIS